MALADLERVALDDAYQAAIQEAYDRLIGNITDGVDDPVGKFVSAVNTARDARTVAGVKLGLTPRNERNSS